MTYDAFGYLAGWIEDFKFREALFDVFSRGAES